MTGSEGCFLIPIFPFVNMRPERLSPEKVEVTHE